MYNLRNPSNGSIPIRQADGNKSEAARLLGITRRRLYSMIERFGIDD